MFRKTVSALILLAFLFNIMGYYILFEVDRSLARKQMMMALREQNTVLKRVIIPGAYQNPGFEKIGDDEFRFNGKYYDYVTEARQGDDLVFLCLNDHREDNLAEGLKNVHSHKLLQALLDHLVKFASAGEQDPGRSDAGSPMNYPRLCLSLETAWIGLHTPPPKPIPA